MDGSLNTIATAFRPSTCLSDSDLAAVQCDRDRYVDWRWRTAINLATARDAGNQVQQGDVWIEEAIGFLQLTFHGWGERQPSDVQRAIWLAARFASRETLARAIIEARLLAQESLDTVGTTCATPRLVLDAYAALFFDVAGYRGRHVWGYASTFGHLCGNILKRGLGDAIRQHAFHHPHEAVDEMVAVVLRLTGPSMADGLPPPQSPEWAKEARIRLSLAESMLRPTAKSLALRREAEGVVADALTSDLHSPQACEAICRLLAAVKLPAATRKEIQALRRGKWPIEHGESPNPLSMAIGRAARKELRQVGGSGLARRKGCPSSGRKRR